MLRVPCVWKFALSMRARECESKAHLFSIKMQFTCNTMRTLNTNHTDVLKENNKKRAKKRVQNLIFQTIPMEFIYISQKKILLQMHFVWKLLFLDLHFFLLTVCMRMYERQTLDVFNENYDDKDFQTTSIYIV